MNPGQLTLVAIIQEHVRECCHNKECKHQNGLSNCVDAAAGDLEYEKTGKANLFNVETSDWMTRQLASLCDKLLLDVQRLLMAMGKYIPPVSFSSG